MLDKEILEIALVGLEARRQELERKIADVRSQLGGERVPTTTTAEAVPAAPKRTISAAARRRIAAAQNKRWQEFHKQSAAKQTVKVESRPAKRKMSDAARAKLVENLAKARAARAAKRTGAAA